MSQIIERKPTWRTAAVLLLLISLAGPWFFDKIYVPRAYECAGAVRLEGDFCGIGISGVKAAAMVIGMTIYTVTQVIAEGNLPQRARELGIELVFLLAILPLFSLAYLELRGRQQRRHRLHIAILSLGCMSALAVVVISVISERAPGVFWELWGPWLYFGALLGSLAAELFSRRREKAAAPPAG